MGCIASCFALFMTVVGLCCLPFRGARRTGVIWTAVGLLSGVVAFVILYVTNHRSTLHTPSPDGTSMVWVQDTWYGECQIRWRGPGGRGKFDVGPSRRIIISPDPMLRPDGFLWFPRGDRFLVRWNWGGRDHVVMEVASGELRVPTKDEAVWLLEGERLDDRGRRLIWRMSAEWLGYDMPEELEPTDQPTGGE